jgi:hypothetical protein
MVSVPISSRSHDTYVLNFSLFYRLWLRDNLFFNVWAIGTVQLSDKLQTLCLELFVGSEILSS